MYAYVVTGAETGAVVAVVGSRTSSGAGVIMDSGKETSMGAGLGLAAIAGSGASSYVTVAS